MDENEMDRLHAVLMGPEEVWERCLKIANELKEEVYLARQSCYSSEDKRSESEVLQFLEKAKRYYAYTRLMKMFKELCERLDETEYVVPLPEDEPDRSDMN